jgi:hypothetical protein
MKIAELITNEEVDFIEGDIISVEGKNTLFQVRAYFKGEVVFKNRIGVTSISNCTKVAHVDDFIKDAWYEDVNGNICQFDQITHAKSGVLAFNFNNSIKSKPDGSTSGSYQLQNFIPIKLIQTSTTLIVDEGSSRPTSWYLEGTDMPNLKNNITTGNGIYDKICSADVNPYEGTITTEHLKEAVSYIYADNDHFNTVVSDINAENKSIINYLTLVELQQMEADAFLRGGFKEKKKRGSEKIEIFL